MQEHFLPELSEEREEREMKRIIRKLLASAMAVALIFGCAGAEGSVDAEGLFQEGLSAYNKNDYAEALEKLTPAATAGYAPAQCYLGSLYFDGNGVERNREEGVAWWTRAAEQGDALAQSNLGFAYAEGIGAKRDREQSVKWYMKAAEGDEANSAFTLEELEEISEDSKLDQDCAQVLGWFLSAHGQGDADAQYNLAMAYMGGVFVDRDYALARKWLERAADQGSAMAQAGLAAMPTEGAMEEASQTEGGGHADAAALQEQLGDNGASPDEGEAAEAEDSADAEEAGDEEEASDDEEAEEFEEDKGFEAPGEAEEIEEDAGSTEEITAMAAIKVAQEELNKLGYDCGAPDGIAGKKTRSAITQFQRDNGLTVTGTLDAETAARLTKILRESRET